MNQILQVFPSHFQMALTLKRRTIIEQYLKVKKDQTFEEVVKTVLGNHGKRLLNLRLKSSFVSNLKSDFMNRWKKSRRITLRFFKLNQNWLEKDIDLRHYGEWEGKSTENLGSKSKSIPSTSSDVVGQ